MWKHRSVGWWEIVGVSNHTARHSWCASASAICRITGYPLDVPDAQLRSSTGWRIPVPLYRKCDTAGLHPCAALSVVGCADGLAHGQALQNLHRAAGNVMLRAGTVTIDTWDIAKEGVIGMTPLNSLVRIRICRTQGCRRRG